MNIGVPLCAKEKNNTKMHVPPTWIWALWPLVPQKQHNEGVWALPHNGHFFQLDTYIRVVYGKACGQSQTLEEMWVHQILEI